MMANGITNLRNPLDERLSQVFTPSADTQKVTGQQSLTESIARGTRAEQALPEVLSTSAAQERAAVEGLMRQRTEGAQRVGELGRQQAKETAAFEEKFQAMRPAPIEFAPSQENIGDLQNIMAQMVLIGGLIGGSSKRSGIAGLKAIKGMLDGYKQGRKDIFDREKLIYEKALDTQRNEITRIKDLYESQLRARTAGNTAEANALTAELNALTQNGTANIDLVRGDTKRVVDTLNYAISAKDKASALQEQMRSREEQAKARIAAQEQARQQSIANQLLLEEARQRNRVELRDITAEQRMGTAGPRFQILEATGKKLPTDKLALDVINTGQGLLEVSKLRDRLRDPEVQTGLRAIPAPTITKLRSLIGRETTEGDIMSVINSPELAGSDKTTLFIKDAILAAFKIEQGLTGTRVPVFTQRTVGPILDPRAYSPETYDKLLETRQKELYGRGRDYGFDEKELSAIARVQGMPGTAGVKPATPQAAPQGGEVDAERTRANQAIANGANREAVAKRFKERTGQEL